MWYRHKSNKRTPKCRYFRYQNRAKTPSAGLFKKFEKFMYKDVDEHTLYLKRKDARNFYDI